MSKAYLQAYLSWNNSLGRENADTIIVNLDGKVNGAKTYRYANHLRETIIYLSQFEYYKMDQTCILKYSGL